MTVFDERLEVHGRNELTVAERPVVAAAHAGAGDADDAAEDDQGVGAERRDERVAGEAPGGQIDGAGAIVRGGVHIRAFPCLERG